MSGAGRNFLMILVINQNRKKTIVTIAKKLKDFLLNHNLWPPVNEISPNLVNITIYSMIILLCRTKQNQNTAQYYHCQIRTHFNLSWLKSVPSIGVWFEAENHKTIIMFHYTYQNGIINTYNQLIGTFNHITHTPIIVHILISLTFTRGLLIRDP